MNDILNCFKNTYLAKSPYCKTLVKDRFIEFSSSSFSFLLRAFIWAATYAFVLLAFDMGYKAFLSTRNNPTLNSSKSMYSSPYGTLKLPSVLNDNSDNSTLSDNAVSGLRGDSMKQTSSGSQTELDNGSLQKIILVYSNDELMPRPKDMNSLIQRIGTKENFARIRDFKPFVTSGIVDTIESREYENLKIVPFFNYRAYVLNKFADIVDNLYQEKQKSRTAVLKPRSCSGVGKNECSDYELEAEYLSSFNMDIIRNVPSESCTEILLELTKEITGVTNAFFDGKIKIEDNDTVTGIPSKIPERDIIVPRDASIKLNGDKILKKDETRLLDVETDNRYDFTERAEYFDKNIGDEMTETPYYSSTENSSVESGRDWQDADIYSPNEDYLNYEDVQFNKFYSKKPISDYFSSRYGQNMFRYAV